MFDRLRRTPKEIVDSPEDQFPETIEQQPITLFTSPKEDRTPLPQSDILFSSSNETVADYGVLAIGFILLMTDNIYAQIAGAALFLGDLGLLKLRAVGTFPPEK